MLTLFNFAAVPRITSSQVPQLFAHWLALVFVGACVGLGSWNKVAAQQGGEKFDPAVIRPAVETLCEVIEREYFDEQVAERTTVELRKSLDDGHYAEAESFASLATLLTSDLARHTRDKHLVVEAVARGDDERPTPEGADESRELRGRRTNYGVLRVEILPGNIGYLNLIGFYRPEEASEAILAAFGVLRNADALILDLRDNGGGSPDTAALVLSFFFDEPQSPLFSIVSRSGITRQYTTLQQPPADRHASRPSYILTSQRTFSAGEGIAFLLQQRGRAVVVGEPTAGAANPGRPYPVTANLQVTVPNGQVRSAIDGSNWEGRGVVPDMATTSDDALRVARTCALVRLIADAPPGSWKETLERELQVPMTDR